MRLACSRVAFVGLAAGLWLIGRPAFAEYGLSEGLGLASVLLAVFVATYGLTASLRFITLSRLQARQPARRRAAVRLLGLHTVLAVALCEEGLRLQDAFWWRCALAPLVLALCIGLRLRARRARPRVSWEDYQAAYGRAETWPKITVASTASLLQSTRRAGAASISVDLSTMG